MEWPAIFLDSSEPSPLPDVPWSKLSLGHRRIRSQPDVELRPKRPKPGRQVIKALMKKKKKRFMPRAMSRFSTCNTSHRSYSRHPVNSSEIEDAPHRTARLGSFGSHLRAACLLSCADGRGCKFWRARACPSMERRRTCTTARRDERYVPISGIFSRQGLSVVVLLSVGRIYPDQRRLVRFLLWHCARRDGCPIFSPVKHSSHQRS